MKKHFLKIFSALGIGAATLFLPALPAMAAKYAVSAPPAAAPGSEFRLEVLFDPEGAAINALSGKLLITGAAVIERVEDGSSFIKLWAEEPKAAGSAAREISWSGVVPGGFEGVLSPSYQGARPGTLFSLVLRAAETGEARISVEPGETLRNDGAGTLLSASGATAAVTIRDGAEAGGVSPADTAPPQEFTPQISRSPEVFGGKWFVAFRADDTGSGIDHYEVVETRDKDGSGPSNNAVSPYLLSDQSLKSYVRVKAIDKAGNTRLATIEPRNPLQWYDYPLRAGILIIVIIGSIAGFLIKRKFRFHP